MDTVQMPRPRRHSAVPAHPWDSPARTDDPPRRGGPRPRSAPPVENVWLAQPARAACAGDGSDDTQSEGTSPASSTESSPPSTRPSSPPVAPAARKPTSHAPPHVAGLRAPLAHARAPGDARPRPLYVVLERASMELCRAPPPATHGRHAKQKPTLLTCDDHQGLLVRMGREVSDARPDITHQCLLTLLDSPLNKAGLLKIFIHTTQDLLIAVHPDVRIPRTYKRYSGLMVQLLQHGEIRGVSDAQVLMRILDHPVAHYLPPNTVKLALSAEGSIVPAPELVRRVPPAHALALFVGAHAKGPDDFAAGVVEGRVSVSSYALSASVVCGKVCCAMEDLLGIV